MSKYTPIRKASYGNQYVAIQHVPIDLPESSGVKNFIRKAGAAILYRRVDKVICVSDGIKQNLNQALQLSQNSLQTIYNQVLDTSISDLANEPVEYEDYFVCVGRLHYQKGYDILLNIAEKCKKQGQRISIVILGEGEERASLEKEITKRCSV